MKPTPSLYLRKLLFHANNVFSIISLLLALLTLVLPLDMVTKALPVSVLAVLSILGAGFYTWKEVIDKFPERADLSIVYRSIGFGANSSSGGMPHSPMRFQIGLDLINRGQETATLTEFKVAVFEMNTALLAEEPRNCRLSEVILPYGPRDISLPYQIPGGQREPNLRCEVQVELHQKEPLQFARHLGKLQNYRIDLQYTYEDMERAKHTEIISIQESFAAFRENIIQEWKERKQFELVTEALGI